MSTTTWAATARITTVFTDTVPRQASRTTNANATTEAVTDANDAATSAFPCSASTPTRSASHANGPPGAAPEGSAGCSGEPGTDATSAVAAIPTTKPATDSVDDREARSTGLERITARIGG